MDQVIPFDPYVGYLCVNGTAQSVPADQLTQQAMRLSAGYYNGPTGTQEQMNAWCQIGHPVTSPATEKVFEPAHYLPVTGGSLYLTMYIVALIMIVGKIIRRDRW